MNTQATTKYRIRRLAVPLAIALLVGLTAGCTTDTDSSETDSKKEESNMERNAINPWKWSVELGFNQAELVEGGDTVLYLAGQSSMGPDGTPQHAGDMAAQINLALDNLEAVLAEAGMDLSDIVRLNTYTTDVDTMFANYGIVAERLGAAGVAPPGSLLGVARLAFPELMVEFEATVVR